MEWVIFAYVAILLVFVIGVVIIIRDYWPVRKFRNEDKSVEEVVEFVKSYASRCTASNRFVVTKETLTDSFPEYRIETIKRAWLKLIDEKVIQQDPMDGEWCISRRG